MASPSVAERLASLPPSDRKAAFSLITETDAEALLYDWRGFLARSDQVAPSGDWDIWCVLSGRGWGKTRTGAEWIKEEVASGRARRIALVAETAADCRDVIVEGESGILNCYPFDQRPIYEPSKRRITWPNGATASLFNATEPDQLRGPQFDTFWCDELAKWRYARETWDMLQFGLRLGHNPRGLVTTTPRPIELVKAILAGQEGRVAVTRGRTMDNSSNLAASFLEKISARYAGTRLGRQELDGEILGDIPNALFSLAKIDAARVSTAPATMGRVVIAVDPAVTNTDESDEHGIVAAGVSRDGKDGYVLEDGSIKGSPMDWARRAVAMFDSWEADAIVVEVNQGGDMVSQTIRSVRANIPIVEVRASRGKHVRAEPIASLYEQGRIHHVGAFVELESQMTMMTSAGYQGERSPDRLDAAVWAMSSLFNMMTRERPIVSTAPPPRLNMPASRR